MRLTRREKETILRCRITCGEETTMSNETNDCLTERQAVC